MQSKCVMHFLFTYTQCDLLTWKNTFMTEIRKVCMCAALIVFAQKPQNTQACL